ncbi:YbjN domain-containing protein [Aphanothece sacrum]|uniref:YbjN domain-containing protein n=1 Tax=Aphanothece sacrum FPU1 TaxID=1920663 RepID=A0A401INT5_APHSA|nr:YbjN domain-containing protein [Aphanothece sacrum]GBF82902.1 hypothetical protein AsFPU1_4336 [Aphanothece sacrum FPU1]GBF85964.1 hypothetical protein AsFPU3_3034 [Aphanothece sacrum FPU3]
MTNSITEMAIETPLPDDFIQTNSTHQEVIETVIGSLQQNDTAMVQHDEQGYVWKFHYGSVETFVQLTGETDEDLLTVWAPVLQLPAKDQLGLMRKLLEMNWGETFETCFGIMQDKVVVLTQRTVADLSPGEISRAITLVATIADDNDEILKETFGGT